MIRKPKTGSTRWKQFPTLKFQFKPLRQKGTNGNVANGQYSL